LRWLPKSSLTYLVSSMSPVDSLSKRLPIRSRLRTVRLPNKCKSIC